MIINVKDVIYQKRKQVKEMIIADVKGCLLKKMNITKTRYILLDKEESFEEKWNSFIVELRVDMHTRNSWYMI